MNSILILLSTFNGEKYLEEQLNSLISQTNSDWICLIRDDGSTDNTINIINKYIERYPQKFIFTMDSYKNLGACKSFLELLKLKSADYYMFCDQDDVWYADKVELTLEKMKEFETLYSKETPLLVHTDLEVVDSNLKTIANSMFEYQKLDSSLIDLKDIMIQNNITGCTMMINDRLKRYLNANNTNIIMHDWWLGLIASAFGKIGFINKPLIKYRQHELNCVGAKGLASSFKVFIRKSNKSQSIRATLKQATTFLKVYEKYLAKEDKTMLDNYGNFLNENLFVRINSMYKFKYKKSYWIKDIMYKFLLLTLKSR